MPEQALEKCVIGRHHACDADSNEGRRAERLRGPQQSEYERVIGSVGSI